VKRAPARRTVAASAARLRSVAEPPDAPPPIAHRVGPLAQRLGLPRASVYRLVADGVLPSVRIPGHRVVLVLEADLAAFLAQHRRAGPGPARGATS